MCSKKVENLSIIFRVVPFQGEIPNYQEDGQFFNVQIDSRVRRATYISIAENYDIT
jgi:NAD(P)H-flavin reductase